MKINENDVTTLTTIKAAFGRWDNFRKDCDESIADDMHNAFFGTILRACSLLSSSFKTATKKYVDWKYLSDTSMSYYDYDSDMAIFQVVNVQFLCDEWLNTGVTKPLMFGKGAA